MRACPSGAHCLPRPCTCTVLLCGCGWACLWLSPACLWPGVWPGQRMHSSEVPRCAALCCASGRRPVRVYQGLPGPTPLCRATLPLSGVLHCPAHMHHQRPGQLHVSLPGACSSAAALLSLKSCPLCTAQSIDIAAGTGTAAAPAASLTAWVGLHAALAMPWVRGTAGAQQRCASVDGCAWAVPVCCNCAWLASAERSTAGAVRGICWDLYRALLLL